MKSVFRSPGIALFSFLAAVVLPALASSAAQAQSTKIFVASYGNDANDGSRGTPKRNFQAAHDAVSASGQIVVLDTAGYGALTITKSLAITVPPGVHGFVTVTGDNSGIFVNAGSSAVVSLRGLVIEGNGSTGSNSNAIVVTSVGNLSVDDCTLRNFVGGLFFMPTNSARLYVYNTTVRGCAFALDLEIDGANAAVATINHCRLEQNAYGLLAAVLANGSNDVSVADCIVSGNSIGLYSENALVRVDNSHVTGNGEGVSTASGGQVLSRGNNTLEANTSGNAFAGTYNAK